MAIKIKILPLVCAVTCAWFADASAASEPAAWALSHFEYETNGVGVADALNVFAAAEHVPVRLSGHIEGTLSGRYAMTPQQFLDTLAASYGLVWYFVGAVLEVAPASDVHTVAVKPNYMRADALKAALEHSQATADRFPLRVDTRAGTVIVTGPTGYTERLVNAARRFEDSARAHTRTTVRVFRLNVATAADQIHTVDGRTSTVPGAASLLQLRVARARLEASRTATQPGIEFDAPLPIIEADAQTNSILVRDKPERIDADGLLVEQVDTRAELISIATWSVDIDETSWNALQAQLLTGDADAQGLAVATLADGGRTLLAQINDLARAQHARIDIARTELAFDRSPVVMDRHEAQLATKATDPDDPAPGDTSVSVVPTLVGDFGQREIELSVSIGDALDEAAPATPGSQAHGLSGTNTVSATVMLGDCLVVVAPAGRFETEPGHRRLVLLVPRVAA